MEQKPQNPLAAYLAEKKIKRAHFASMIGVTRARITQICNGWVAHIDLANRIERETDGGVPADSWLNKPAPSTAENAA